MVRKKNLKKIKFHKSTPLVLAVLLTLTLGFSGLATQKVVAYSGGTTIQATICDNQPPVLNIVSPINGQVVNMSTVNLGGTTKRTTQIGISINGNFSQNVAVGLNQVFNTQLSLVAGTNVIKLDSYFSCNQTSSSDTITVTYKPSPQPVTPHSNGSGSNSGPGFAGGPGLVNITRPTVYAEGNSQISKPKPQTNKPKSPIERAKNNLGFGGKHANIKDSLVVPLASWLSLVIATLALMFALMPVISTIWFRRLFNRDRPISLPRKISINILRLIAFIIAIMLLLFVQI